MTAPSGARRWMWHDATCERPNECGPWCKPVVEAAAYDALLTDYTAAMAATDILAARLEQMAATDILAARLEQAEWERNEWGKVARDRGAEIARLTGELEVAKAAIDEKVYEWGQTMLKENAALREVVLWVLGEGDGTFPPLPDDWPKRKFYWRSVLREKFKDALAALEGKK